MQVIEDGFEFDDFERMVASEAWKRYSDRIRLALAQEVANCLTENVPERKADHARGGVAALNLALSLPETMLDEYRRGKS